MMMTLGEGGLSEESPALPQATSFGRSKLDSATLLPPTHPPKTFSSTPGLGPRRGGCRDSMNSCDRGTEDERLPRNE